MIFNCSSEVFSLQLQGCLDQQEGLRLKQQLALIEPERHNFWIIDLSQVDFIDSAGLFALISALNTAKQKQCRLVIGNPRPAVKLIFEITQLDQVLEILDDAVELAPASRQESNRLLVRNSELAVA